MDGLGSSGPDYFGSLFQSALRIGENIANKKLGTTVTAPQTLGPNPLFATYPAYSTSQSSGGASFGIDNSTLLLIGLGVVLLVVLK